MLNTSNTPPLTHDPCSTPPPPLPNSSPLTHNLTVSVVKAPVHGVEDEAEQAVLLVQLDVVSLVLTDQWNLSLTDKLHNVSVIFNIVL